MSVTNAQATKIIAGERLRIMAILESPAGLANPAIARDFALRRNMDAEDAIDILAKLPPANPLLAAMASETVGILPSQPDAGTLMNSADAKKQARIAEIEAQGAAMRAARNYNPNVPRA